MSNSFKVVDMVLRESLRLAHEKAAFIGTIDRSYDKDFKYDAQRGPKGTTQQLVERRGRLLLARRKFRVGAADLRELQGLG